MNRHLVSTYVNLSLILTIIFTLAGCGSVSGNSPTPTPTPVANPSPTPTPIGSPTPSPAPTPSPTPVASAQIVYQASFTCTPGNPNCASDQSTDGVYAFRVNQSTGAVTAAPGSPFFTGSNAEFVVTVPSGNFVFAADTTVEVGASVDLGSNDIVTFRPDPVTGALTKLATTSLTGLPIDMVMHPSGHFLYLSTGEMIGFSINQTSGSLTPISIPTGLTNSNGTHSMAIDPTGQFLYAAGTDRVWGFRIDSTTGGLTPLPGSPFTFPNFPFLGDISIHPSGKFLYLPNQTPTVFEIFGMSIDPATGTLTLLPDSPYAADSQAGFSEMVFVKDGATAFAGSTNKTFTVFSVNTSTGTLTSEGTDAAPFFIFGSMALDQTGQFVYAASSGGLLGFHVQGDGTAEVLPGFPQAAGLGTGAHSVAIAPLP